MKTYKRFITSMVHAGAVTVTAGLSGVYMCDTNKIEVSRFYRHMLGLSISLTPRNV